MRARRLRALQRTGRAVWVGGVVALTMVVAAGIAAAADLQAHPASLMGSIAVQGERAWTVDTADVDADGDLDVLVGSESPNVTVLHRNVMGEPGAPASGFTDVIPLGNRTGPRFARFSDLDRDGDPDIVTVNEAGLYWIENVGGRADQPNEGFAAEVRYTEPFSGYHEGVVGDADGDGDDDVIVASINGTAVTLLRNASPVGGPIAFDPPLTIDDTAGLRATGANLGDVDDDGDLDLVVTTREPDIRVYLADAATGGPDGFTDPTILADPGFGAVAVGDVDHDDLADIIVHNSGYQWLRSQVGQPGAPASGFEPAVPISDLAFGTFGQTPWLVDVDDDGDLDLFTGESWLANERLPAGGAPDADGFGPPRVIDLPAGARAFDMAPADVDGDGDDDAVVASLVSGPYLLDNVIDTTPDPGFAPPTFLSPEGSGWDSVDAADIDGDGDADVTYANEFGGVGWIPNERGEPGQDVDGLGDPLRAMFGPGGVNGHDVFDIDGDGDPDLIGVLNLEGDRRWSLVWAANQHDEAVVPATGFGPPIEGDGLGFNGRGGVGGDVDHDGDLDALVWDFNTLFWAPNEVGEAGGAADGFGAPVVLLDDGSRITDVVATDVDGDTDDDLVVATSNAGLLLLENLTVSSTAAFAAAGDVAAPVTLSGLVVRVGDVTVADFDGDGDEDLIAPFQDAAPNRGMFHLTNTRGEGTDPDGFADPVQLTSRGNFTTTGDMDGDGDIDAVAVDNTVLMAANRFGEPDAPPTGFDPGDHIINGGGVAVMVDLDGDGDDDPVFGLIQTTLHTTRTYPGVSADAGGPYEVAQGDPLALDGSATTGGFGPLEFLWDVDGDGTHDTTGRTPTFDTSELAPGDYTVRLRVNDPEPVSGRSATTTLTVTEAATPPTTNPGTGSSSGGSDDGETPPAQTPTEGLIPTAIEVAGERYSPTSFAQGAPPPPFVVLSRDDVFADSLTASVLLGDAPILFTAPAVLDPRTAAEIDRLFPEGGTVVLVGGEQALSPAVDASLTAAGHTTQRLEGPSRIETAVAVADFADERFGPTPSALVARAYGVEGDPTAAWADSVSGGAWAASTRTPVLLTTSDALHPAVSGWLSDRNGVEPIVVGEENAVSTTAASALGPHQRIGGPNRFGTAISIADQLWATTSGAYVSTAANHEQGWGYGLVAAGIGADEDRPLLLVETDRLPAETAAKSVCVDGTRTDIRVLGGLDVVGQEVRDALTSPC